MADEITVSLGLRATNGNLKINDANYTNQFDQATARGNGPGTVNVGTSEQTIDFGDITPGWVQFTNLDDTNFVELGFSTGVYGIKLSPEGGALFELTDTTPTIYAVADTAACDVQVKAVNK